MSNFPLKAMLPFRLDLTVSMLRRVPTNEMDRWNDGVYKRVIVVGDRPVQVCVAQAGQPNSCELLVMSTEPGLEKQIACMLKKILGLDIDLRSFYEIVSIDKRLKALVERFSGFRPPRFETTYEAIINGISCQQLSLRVGLALLNRICVKYGREINGQHAFPRPADMLKAQTDDLRALGYSTSKAKYILAISQSIVDGDIDLDCLEQMDDGSAIDYLCSIYGVGRWTAQYTALRGLGRLDVYPADDAGGQTKIQNWFSLDERPDYNGVHRIIDRFSPYRGLLYFYLFLDQQEKMGMISTMENII